MKNEMYHLGSDKKNSSDKKNVPPWMRLDLFK